MLIFDQKILEVANTIKNASDYEMIIPIDIGLYSQSQFLADSFSHKISAKIVKFDHFLKCPYLFKSVKFIFSLYLMRF